jgi:hypothetical protein
MRAVLLVLLLLPPSGCRDREPSSLAGPEAAASGLLLMEDITYLRTEAAADVRVPIFRLQEHDAEKVFADFTQLAPANGAVESFADGNRLVSRQGDETLEVHRSSGGVWFADDSRLWNPRTCPVLPELRELGEIFVPRHHAEGSAERTMAERALDFTQIVRELVQDSSQLRLVYTGGASHAAVFDVDTQSELQRCQLDTQLNIAVQVRAQDPSGKPHYLPVVGGGGKFNITFGEGGDVISFSGVWRPVRAGQLEWASVEPPVPAEDPTHSFLAYYAPPAPIQTDVLCPVWVQRPVSSEGGMLGRLVMTPASSHPWCEGLERSLRETGEAAEEPSGQEPVLTPHSPDWQARAYWMEVHRDALTNGMNPQGFLKTLSASCGSALPCWSTTGFAEAQALRSHWIQRESQEIDTVDLVFFTGHAGHDGWSLWPDSPSDLDAGHIISRDTAPPADPDGQRWGNQRLRWLIIAACGPLQDSRLISGGGSAGTRWHTAFDGLRQLLGYAAVSFDHPEEGALFVRHSLEGSRNVHAWFRAAREVQPLWNGAEPPNGPRIWVGGILAREQGAGADAFEDRLTDPPASTGQIPRAGLQLVLIWTTT